MEQRRAPTGLLAFPLTPLVEPTTEHIDELAAIIASGRAALAEVATR